MIMILVEEKLVHSHFSFFRREIQIELTEGRQLGSKLSINEGLNVEVSYSKYVIGFK